MSIELKNLRYAISIAVVLVLGIFAWDYFFGKLAPSSQEAPKEEEQEIMTGEESPQDQQAVYTPPEPPETLDPQEHKLFLLLGKQNPAANEQNRIIQLAEALAKEADEIRFQNCVPHPFVLKKKDGERVDIRNAGPDTITLTMMVVDKRQTLTIAPDGSEPIIAGFGKGNGLFGYSCSSVSGNNTGLIMVK